MNALLTEVNLTISVDQIKTSSSWMQHDRGSAVLYKSDSMRILIIGLHKGAKLDTHTAPGDISVQVLEGKVIFGTDQKIVEIEKGSMIMLQEKVPHSVHAIEESFFLLTISMNK